MIALCCLVVAKAQTDVPIAVLQSGNNVSVFKGAGGLAAAHDLNDFIDKIQRL